MFLCGRILSRHVLFSPKLRVIYELFTYKFYNIASGPGEKNHKAVLECFSLSDALQQKSSISDNIRGSVQAINMKFLNPSTDPFVNE
jgi:hypothetical protein